MILAGALLLAIALVVVALYHSGARVPLHTTARLCLWEKLRVAGLAQKVAPACVNDIADFLSAGLSLVAQRGEGEGALARGELLARLDRAVHVVDAYLHGRDLPPDDDARPVTLLLAKHGIGAGAAAGTDAPPSVSGPAR